MYYVNKLLFWMGLIAIKHLTALNINFMFFILSKLSLLICKRTVLSSHYNAITSSSASIKRQTF